MGMVCEAIGPRLEGSGVGQGLYWAEKKWGTVATGANPCRDSPPVQERRNTCAQLRTYLYVMCCACRMFDDG